MKKYTILLLLIFLSMGGFAQPQNPNEYVNKFVSIPAIAVTTIPDSTIFTNINLQKNTPFFIMFFSPDCDHCHIQTKELLAYKEELKGIQILLLSIAPYQEIKNFYDEFGLSAMPNLSIGQDVNFKLGSTYRISTYPSIFLYDQKGNLAKAFIGNIGIPAILDALR